MRSLPYLALLAMAAPAVLLAGARPAGARQLAGDTNGLHGPPPPAPPEVIARDAAGRFTLRAVRLDQPLVLDGRLDEAIYRTIAPVSDFIQQEPREGEVATEKTEVWTFFDGRNLYVGARCWDSQPDRMVANDMRRDGPNIFQNENFAVALDTFYDRRNGVFFDTNPLGALFDGTITDERDINRDWNAVWEVKAARFENGWTVEMAIPFKSLRYRRGGPQVWGINYQRIVRWKNEFSHLGGIPASYGPSGLTRLSHAGTLVGLEAPTKSKNLEIKPYATSSLTTDRIASPRIENDMSGGVGFDVKYGVTRSLTSDFTYNTDFAQVEDDEQQVNLTRFGLFFPEKREFFLEGQGVFSFGGVQSSSSRAGPPSDTPVLFFSRRIGLSSGRAVPIDAGARVTGKAGRYGIGALHIRTGDDPAAEALATDFSVVRVKRDVLRRSYIGVIATRRSPSLDGADSNHVVGADARFLFFQNLNIAGYYARSRTPGRAGKDASHRAQLDYAGDRYGLQLEQLSVGENFNPEIGFLRREDFRRRYVQARFSPRPASIPAIRKFSYEASLASFVDGKGTLESRRALGTFRIDFENGDQWNVDYSREHESLDEGFGIARGVVVGAGRYRFQNVQSVYRLGPQRRLPATITLGGGSFFSGDEVQAAFRGRLELTRQLAVEPGLSVNRVRLAEVRFTAKLLTTRTSLALTPRIFLGALVQYNSSLGALGANIRFRWEYEPGSDLFVVYTEGRNTQPGGYGGLENRGLIVKVAHLFRF